jgi:hypothetical protein
MSVARPLVLATAAALALASASFGPPAAADGGCQRWDLEVVCTTDVPKVTLGWEFGATATVRNTGDTALANVTLTLRGDQGSPCVSGPGPVLKLTIEKLEPGESKQVSGRFLPENVGTARVLGSAHDSLGWASANCACTVDVQGLVAIQASMVDKALGNAEKGVFEVGESYLYSLDVESDGATEATPDLKIVFALPQEVQFVSATASGGVTIKGAGQNAESTPFKLVAPNQKLHVDLTVKVIAAPKTRMVKAHASVQTVTGVELAHKTESTTIKLASASGPTPPAPPVPTPAPATAPATAPAMK